MVDTSSIPRTNGKFGDINGALDFLTITTGHIEIPSHNVYDFGQGDLSIS